MDEFDPSLRGVSAADQIGDLYMRLRGIEDALVEVVDAIHQINPDLLADARRRFRLRYQEARDHRPMDRRSDQAMLLRFLAQRLHVLEHPAERIRQRPPQAD